MRSDTTGPAPEHGEAAAQASLDRRQGRAVVKMFRMLFAIDVLVASVVVYFFVVGLIDGSVSGFNATIWVAILAVPAAILGGGWALRAAGRVGLACGVLALMAVPAGMVASMTLMLVVLQTNWR